MLDYLNELVREGWNPGEDLLTKTLERFPVETREKAESFCRALFAMRWENPRHRRLFELEGLREWLPAREEGYVSLQEALEQQEKDEH